VILFSGGRKEIDPHVKQEHQELPTGKVLIRLFNEDGSPLREQHSYGNLEIGLMIEFQNGEKAGEFYFSKRRMCSRKTYESRRASYPDMPAADSVFFDGATPVLRAVATEKRTKSRSMKSQVRDSERATPRDTFCRELMGRGKMSDVAAWILSPKHTLGELSHRASRGLVSRLLSQGAIRILACEIDVEEDGLENTGHLVVELPREPAKRATVLKTIARIARKQGYEGDPDDGQNYAYVKLD